MCLPVALRFLITQTKFQVSIFRLNYRTQSDKVQPFPNITCIKLELADTVEEALNTLHLC